MVWLAEIELLLLEVAFKSAGSIGGGIGGIGACMNSAASVAERDALPLGLTLSASVVVGRAPDLDMVACVRWNGP